MTQCALVLVAALLRLAYFADSYTALDCVVRLAALSSVSDHCGATRCPCHDSPDCFSTRVQFLIHVGKKLVNLHENGWVHRDLKVRTFTHPAALMINASGNRCRMQHNSAFCLLTLLQSACTIRANSPSLSGLCLLSKGCNLSLGLRKRMGDPQAFACGIHTPCCISILHRDSDAYI